MNSKTLRLKQENQRLKEEVNQLQTSYNEAMREIDWLKEQIELAKKAMYGRSSEKADVAPGQLSFFNEAEFFLDPEVEEPEEIISKKPAKKKRRRRTVRAAKCLRNTMVHDVSNEIKEKYGDRLRLITEEGNKRDELIYHEPYFEVITHLQKIYTVDGEFDEQGKALIFKGDMPLPVLDKSFASPELIGKVIADKYVYSLPLYRQETSFEEMGINISRQTMSNWIIGVYDRYFMHMISHMHGVLTDELHHIIADETTVQVLHDSEKTSGKSYMWGYMSGRSEDKQFIIYDYERDRRHEHAGEYLQGFSGILESDGYGAYDKVPDVINARDWTHVRRKFQEVLDSAPKGTDVKGTYSYKIRRMIGELYHIEKKLDPSKMSFDEIKEARQEKSKPIVDRIFEFIKESLPYMAAGTRVEKACRYALTYEDDLRQYLDDGRIDITTNAIERKMKAFVIGRKNWLFSNTVNGARASAAAYSLVESAKMNDLIPERYLTYILRKLPYTDLKDKDAIESIMPWAELPEELYKNKRS